MELHEKPLAAKGYISYRYEGRYGFIMIGAKSPDEAISEANRSLSQGRAEMKHLQVWDTETGIYKAINNG